jgi:alanine racemase
MKPARSRPAWIEVDLAGLLSNAKRISQIVAPARIVAVVKAEAYGHGAIEVAKALSGKVAGFAVATVEESLELRMAGIDDPIMLLGEASLETLGDLAGNKIMTTVHCTASLELISRLSVSTKRRIDYQLELDTGMHRLGLDEARAMDLMLLAERSRTPPWGLYSHFARADELEDGGLTERQLARFVSFASKVKSMFPGRAIRMHIAATAAALHHPGSQLDMVRIGLGLYGYDPHPDALAGLEPVLSVKARVVQVREIEPGEGVSYGHKRIFGSATRIATVPVGYGDGIPRLLFNNGGEVLIHGQRYPIAGIVTMDHMMIAVDDNVKPGDEAVILGRQGSDAIWADEIAHRVGTIPYEILARLSARLPRIYLAST